MKHIDLFGPCSGLEFVWLILQKPKILQQNIYPSMWDSIIIDFASN